MTKPSDPEDSEVAELLGRLARAMTTGDHAAISAMWQVPAYVLEEDGVHALGSREEIEGGARGIADARPEITRVEWLTDRVAMVSVRWPHGDEPGSEGIEASTYLLRRDDAGELRICVRVSSGATRRH